MSKLKVSIIQLDVLLGKPAKNRERALSLIDEVSKEGSRAVLLPELWTTGYADRIDEMAETTSGKTVSMLSAAASKRGLYVIGSIAEKDEKLTYNTCLVIGPQGLIGHYRKTHLFSPMGENKLFNAGGSYSIYHTAFGTIGTAICYDIRFPELCRSIALAGAKILFVPAEWPHPRTDQWKKLLMGRAIENQMFVVGCNRVGSDKSTKYLGHSIIVDPAGLVLAEGNESETVLTCELDLETLDRIRQKIPCFNERNEAAYRKQLDFFEEEKKSQN